MLYIENRSHCIIKLEIRSKVDYYSEIVREIYKRRGDPQMSYANPSLLLDRSEMFHRGWQRYRLNYLVARRESRWNSEENFPWKVASYRVLSPRIDSIISSDHSHRSFLRLTAIIERTAHIKSPGRGARWLTNQILAPRVILLCNLHIEYFIEPRITVIHQRARPL